jgi:hypothetical protein
VTNQYFYQGYTLIDITPTGVISYTPAKEKERNQQRNWETVQQIISLRTQPTVMSVDDFVDDVKNYHFGVHYTGTHRIWRFNFAVEYADIYQAGNDKFGLVKYDFKITPVILGLTETAVPSMPLFYPNGPLNNIYFKPLV